MRTRFINSAFPRALLAAFCSVAAASAALWSKAMACTEDWRQACASQGNGGNALVLAGLSQWGAPFADMMAYQINTEGQGARPTMDGMNAFGFPWCVFGRAPDVELVENEFPLLVPISQHWRDSCGHGKYRGGGSHHRVRAGTA